MPSPRRTVKKKTRAANAKRPSTPKAKPARKPAAVIPAGKEVSAPQFGKKIKAKAVEFRKRGNQIIALIWS